MLMLFNAFVICTLQHQMSRHRKNLPNRVFYTYRDYLFIYLFVTEPEFISLRVHRLRDLLTAQF